MSNHFRYCPKHRKPLPCPHCALAQTVVQPNTLPGFVSDDLKCDYQLFEGAWVCVYCARPADMTADGPAVTACAPRNIKKEDSKNIIKEIDRNHADKDRRAKAEKDRRKAKADQIAAIKKALQTPVAEIRAA